MTLPVVIPNEFANATASIPLSQLDSNFSTLANVVNEINAGTQQLANANVAVLIVNAGTSAAPTITTTGDTNTGIFFPAADTIAFAEGGAEAMRIDSSGRVGIGVTPSINNAKLTTVGGPVQLSPGSTSQEGIRLTRATGICQINGINNDNNVYNALTFATGASEAMRIDTSGNVGIGTSSPAGRLDVNGGRTFLAANSEIYALGVRYNSTTGSYYIGATNSATPDLVFSQVGGSERMRVTNDGNLLVGVTSQFSSGKICEEFDGQVYNGIVLKDTNATLNGNYLAFYNSAGNNAGAISHNGTTTVSYVTSSDYRLKENIAPMTGALAKVAQLKPCTYTWKVDGSDGQGFIAHELQEVAPYAVTGEKDGEQMQGVDYGKITPLLTAALQEAIAEIQSLKARVAELEAK